MMLDLFVELIFELLVEGFVSLCEVFIPRRLKLEKTRHILTLIVLALATTLFVCMIFGVVTLLETHGKSLFGWVTVGLAAVYVSVGVLLKLLVHKNRR